MVPLYVPSNSETVSVSFFNGYGYHNVDFDCIVRYPTRHKYAGQSARQKLKAFVGGGGERKRPVLLFRKACVTGKSETSFTVRVELEK